MATGKPLPFLFLDVNTLHDFFTPGAPLATERAGLARTKLRELYRAITKAGLIVLAGADRHAPDDPEFAELGLPPHALDGSEGCRKISETWIRGAPVIPASGQRRPWPKMNELRQRGGQLILEKKKLDLFSNPAMQEMLRTLQTKELILFGALLEHDLHATAMTARGLGLEVIIALDASVARDEEAALRSREALVNRKVKFELVEELLIRITLWKKRMEREHHARAGS